MSDVLRPNIFATGASDDAAAAGQIFPAAGIYQATPAEVDDGDVGRFLMNQYRALYNGGFSLCQTDSESWSSSTAGSINAFAWPRWAREAMVALSSSLDQAATVELLIRDQGSVISSGTIAELYSVASDLTAGNERVYGSEAAGTGSTRYVQVAALRGVFYPFYLSVRLAPAASATGSIDIAVTFKG